MAQNSGTGELMESNRVLSVGAIVLLAAFAMATSAQASTLGGAALATGASLSMADTLGTTTDGASSFTVTDLSFDACSGDDCSEADDAAVVTSGGSIGGSGISPAASAAPEPATFVLVGLTLAVLPLIRKKRS